MISNSSVIFYNFKGFLPDFFAVVLREEKYKIKIEKRSHNSLSMSYV